MTAAVESSATVEAAASAIRAYATVVGATGESVNGSAASVTVPWPISKARTISVAWSIAIAESWATIKAVIPGTGANEQSTGKVAWPIVAVRGACVGIVTVVAIRASGRCSNANAYAHGAYADANSYLRARASCDTKKQNSQQCNIFKIFHGLCLVPAPIRCKAFWAGGLPGISPGEASYTL